MCTRGANGSSNGMVVVRVALLQLKWSQHCMICRRTMGVDGFIMPPPPPMPPQAASRRHRSRSARTAQHDKSSWQPHAAASSSGSGGEFYESLQMFQDLDLAAQLRVRQLWHSAFPGAKSQTASLLEQLSRYKLVNKSAWVCSKVTAVLRDNGMF